MANTHTHTAPPQHKVSKNTNDNLGKIFANQITDKRLISPVYKRLLRMKKEAHHPVEKWVRNMNK